MGFFSNDEIVANASTPENTVIASTLVVIVAVLILFVIMRMYTKYMQGKVKEEARREVQLSNLRTV